ncbi:MAG: hypothetical protein ACXVYI_01430 [Mycobacterium sp.]
MTNDTVVFVGRITAQGTSDVVNQLPLWIQELQAVAAVATTIGVLLALYVAVVREPRKAAAERKRHEAQIDALRRVRRKRVAAQARTVFPSCIKTPMFGDSWWTVRIDNMGSAVTRILGVEVKAIGTKGLEVSGGCEQVNNMPLDEAFDRSVLAALSTFSGASEPRSNHLSTTFKHALRDALVGHFATEWERTLLPNQHAVMTYRTTKPEYTLRHNRLRRPSRLSLAAHRLQPAGTDKHKTVIIRPAPTEPAPRQASGACAFDLLRLLLTMTCPSAGISPDASAQRSFTPSLSLMVSLPIPGIKAASPSALRNVDR